MKRLLWLLLLASPCHALIINGVAVPAASSPTTPAPVVAPATSLPDGMHLLDNMIPGGCRDVKNGVWMGCAGEALYKEDYLSLDAVYLIPVGGHGFFSPGLRIYVGQLLMEQVPVVKTIATSNLVLSSALNYLTVGGFYARDFDQGIDRVGYYLGLLAKF